MAKRKKPMTCKEARDVLKALLGQQGFKMAVEFDFMPKGHVQTTYIVESQKVKITSYCWENAIDLLRELS